MVAIAGFTEMQEVRLCLSVEEVREVRLIGMELVEFRLEVRELAVEMVAGEAIHLILAPVEEAEEEEEQEDTGESQQK
jgi:hypothetical protein